MLSTLKETFGFATFRDGQEPVIRTLLEGRPALAIFPTGGGKSLCYQLPALLLDGLTLVVSPLIALMRDQVESLERRGIAAARLDSTLDAGQVAEIYQKLATKSLKLLYIAPERFANETFRRQLKNLDLSMVAVDEAHCISEWGHNFRPDYLKLAKYCRQLKVRRVLALTATATPAVAAEIRKHFRIAPADQVQLSFHRPNLNLAVTPCQAAARKSMLLERLAALDGAAVVYVTRQETAEEVATFLAKRGLSARAYHAGLADDVRAEAQRQFMDGSVRIVVATIAFGMGIDKSDIRAVIHYNLPKSLENYIQEIGRSGRDGKSSVCELMACGEDLIVLENFIFADTPSPRALSNLLDRILRLGDAFDVSTYDLSVTCDIRPTVVSTVLTYLEIAGYLEATGAFYETYKLRLLRPVERVLAGRSKAEMRWLIRLLETGNAGRMWTEFKPTASAVRLGASRAKIVASLAGLEAAGDAVLTKYGARQGFRMNKTVTDIRALADQMAEVFLRREQADLDRLANVLALSAYGGCLTAYLTEYFGETLEAPCGHCDRCRGIGPTEIRRITPRRPTDEELLAVRALVDQNHAALAGERQLARFLCGLTSPATTRARLTRHDAFGIFADLPFADVLVIARTF
jgi:ATP-dependent DNA helicase RecQ